MKAHVVLAHPEPKSFNAHLAALARETLVECGWQVTLTDRYADGFDPCEQASHYRTPLNADRFDTQSEQRHASAEGALPPEVTSEIERLSEADLVILQYPMWWHLPPAILKGWMDRVFVYGEVYKSNFRFENGRFVGKKAMISVTVGTSPETYAFNGRSGDIDLLLWPVNFSLAYVGFDVLPPYVAYGVEAGLRYSDTSVVEQRLQDIQENYRARLRHVESDPVVPFNRMADWGDNGRIKPDAPAYSPFIRHREELKID
ncbi:MAG: NAD(P)H-dependent oxidoreductase [Alphaproteobacteria bacterium]